MNILLFVHIFCGATSLILFWIPAISKKGGRTHRLAGRWYVRFMWVVVLSAIVLSIFNIYSGDIVTGIFLGYLAILTANPLWNAIAILGQKKQLTSDFLMKDRILKSLVFISACALLVYSLVHWQNGASTLLIIFGLIGLPSGLDLYRSFVESGKVNWYTDHVSGMIVSGIAAYTAFFAFGGRVLFENYLTDQWMIIPWILPTVIGTSAIALINRKHKRGQVSADSQSPAVSRPMEDIKTRHLTVD